MIAFRLDAGWLELSDDSISLEIANPLFSYDAVPGTTTYPYGVPMSAANLRNLSFPHLAETPPGPLAAECYVDGVLWRVGALLYDGCDMEKRQFRYRFVSDAGELRSRIEGRSLRSLALGSIALALVHNHVAYGLPCWHAPGFYADKRPAFCGVMNYYRNGAYLLNTGGDNRYAITPFPRLVPTLRAVLGAFGYQVEGDWLNTTEAQALLIWSNRAADDQVSGQPTFAANFELAQHLPDIGVGEFLVAIQKLLALGFTFDPVRRVMRVLQLRDVVGTETYIDRTPGTLLGSTPASAGGYAFTMALESDDELNKTLDTSWTKLTVGAGKTKVESAASTLHTVTAADPAVVFPAQPRNWTVAAAQVKGASSLYELGDDSRVGLRLLYDHGLQADSLGQLYPRATGSPHLVWDGAQGLYLSRHQAWLSFLDAANTVERMMRFRVADLLSLDPARKEMVEGRKYLWQKVAITVAPDRRLETARFTYRSIRV